MHSTIGDAHNYPRYINRLLLFVASEHHVAADLDLIALWIVNAQLDRRALVVLADRYFNLQRLELLQRRGDVLHMKHHMGPALPQVRRAGRGGSLRPFELDQIDPVAGNDEVPVPEIRIRLGLRQRLESEYPSIPFPLTFNVRNG